eukprot:PhF_6_TR25484/c0_g1_i1/m.35424
MSRKTTDDDDVQYTYSEWQKKEVRTLVVNPRNRLGQLKSLSDGIRLAKPYDRVEVVGGDYFETVSIDKPIEIVASEGEVPIVTFRGTAFTFSTNCPSYISGITISCKSKTKDTFAVVVSSGTPTFSKCTISNIKVCGVGKPIITNCDIEQGLSGIGLAIVDQAGGEYIDNFIHTHTEHCVFVDSSSPEIKLKRNTIYQPISTKSQAVIRVTGISHGPMCTPYFENNRLWDQENPSLTDTPLYELRRNSITSPTNPSFLSDKPHRVVVLIDSSAAPTFFNNEIYNGDVGVRCTSDSSPKIIQNRITRNAIIGLHLLGDNGSLIERNKICDNNRTGVQIEVSRNSKVQRNDIYGNSGGMVVDDSLERSRSADQNVVSVFENTFSTTTSFGLMCMGGCNNIDIDGNLFTKNEGMGVIIKDDANPKFHNNKIFEGKSHGIAIGYFGRGIIEHNEIRENSATGIYVDQYASPTSIKYNLIESNRKHGLHFNGISGGRVEHNKFVSNSAAQICVSDGAHPLIQKNNIVEGRTEGIEIRGWATGVFVFNLIAQNRGDGIKISEEADPFLEGNEVTENIGNGVSCCDRALGTFLGNTILRNTQDNVAISTGADVTFRANSISGAGSVGVRIFQGGLSYFEKNIIEENTVANIMIENPTSAPHFIRNRVMNSKTGFGIQSNGGSGKVERNWVTGNGQSGLSSTGGGNTLFVQNTVTQERNHGIIVSDGGSAIFLKNVVTHAAECGVWIEGGTSIPTFQENQISLNEKHGIVCCSVDAKKPQGKEQEGLIQENHIFENKMCGIVCIGNTTVKIVNNEISQNLMSGISLEGARSQQGINSSSPKIVENKIHNNAGYGVAVAHSTSNRARLERNQIHDHKINVFVQCLRDVAPCEFSPPLFIQNDINHAWSENIHVTNYGTSIFRENRICEAPIGIHVSAFGRGDFQKNQLDSLRDVAVRIVGPSSAPNLSENVISSSPIAIEVISQGEGTLSKNTITCDTGIILSGNCKPLVSGNEFKRCKNYGVWIQHQAEGTVSGNTITECQLGGVLIDNDNNGIVLEKNTISENANFGVRIELCGNSAHNNRSTIIESNQIVRNLKYGIIIGTGTSPRTIRNTISSNLDCGVVVERGGLGYLGNNTIERNRGHGVHVHGEAMPEFEHNTILCGEEAGMYFEGNAGGNVFFNTIENNAQCGVVIGSGKTLTFKNNNVGPNGICGVKVVAEVSTSPATPLILENKFYSVREAVSHCMEVSGLGSNPMVDRNTFQDGSIGVIVQEGGKGVFESNTFTSFSKNGVLMMDDETSPIFLRNTFRSNSVGVLVTSNVTNTTANAMSENTFDDNLLAGISLTCSSSIVVSNNSFINHQTVCIAISGRGTGGKILQNNFRSVANLVGIEISDHANPLISDNSFVQCGRAGISVVNTGMGTVDHNLFCGNGFAGLYLSTFCRPVVRRNVFCHQSDCAIYVDHGGDGTIENNDILFNSIGCKLTQCGHVVVQSNTIHDNERNGIHMFQAGDALIQSNYFHTNAEGDILMSDSSSGTVSANLFLGKVVATTETVVKVEKNYFMSLRHLQSLTGSDESPLQGHGVGIVVFDKGNPRLSNNVVCGLALGVSVYRGGRGTFENNTVMYCGRGVEIFDGGDPVLIGNDLKYCTDYGVTVRDGGLGFLTRNNIMHHNKACVLILQGGNPNIDNNKISYGGTDGLFSSGAGTGMVQNNNIFCSKNNVRIILDGNPTLKENFIYDGVIGVIVTGGGRGSMISNSIFDNEMVGFVVESTAKDCTITGNKISSPQDSGAVEIDASTDVTMKQNVIRNQFSPVFNKSLGSTRLKSRRNMADEERVNQEKLDETLSEVKKSFIDLQSSMSEIHEGLLSKGGFDDHNKTMFKPTNTARRALTRGSIVSMRNQVQAINRQTNAVRRTASVKKPFTPPSEGEAKSRPRSTSAERKKREGKRRATNPNPLILPITSNVPAPQLSPLARRKVCFSHIPPASSSSLSVDTLRCEVVDMPSKWDDLPTLMQQETVDLYVCFLTTALAHSTEFYDELKFVHPLEVGKVLFVCVEPEYTLGGICSEPIVRDALGKHRLYVYQSNAELSEIITRGILRHTSCSQLSLAKVPPLAYVSCALQSTDSMHLILRHVVSLHPELRYSLSIWSESKVGKAYNKWIRAGHQSSTHLLAIICEQYTLQSRCMKEYTSFQHLPTTFVALDPSLLTQKQSTPLSTLLMQENPSDKEMEMTVASCAYLWGTGDPNLNRKIADRMFTGVFR